MKEKLNIIVVNTLFNSRLLLGKSYHRLLLLFC